LKAIHKGQVDAASSYFSDDAQIAPPIGQPKGKEKIRAFLFNLVQMKEHDDTLDLAADGTNVTGLVCLSFATQPQNHILTCWGKVSS
jgi:ketosteroid isomerase-like protein